MNKNFDVWCLNSEIRELKAAIENLAISIPDKENCLKLVFFGLQTNNDYKSQITAISTIISPYFSPMPLVSFIPQALCGNYAYGVEITKMTDPDSSLSFHETNEIRYLICKNSTGKFLFLEGINSDNKNQKFQEKCEAVFSVINNILSKEGFKPGEIIRQWNYIGNITNFEAGNQHYQTFNNARTAFYLQDDFMHGYPAATGISIPDDNLIISLIALQPAIKTNIDAIDNHWQIPAYSYSDAVLVDGKTIKTKTTPKFERAKLVTMDDSVDCFVSGTAAIRNERSMYDDDVVSQTRQTIENINFLISNENLKQNNYKKALDLQLNSIRVYIKNPEDYQTVKTEIDKAWPDINTIYVQADICRRELLVEIEGIAS
jgi:hypothetical protein